MPLFPAGSLTSEEAWSLTAYILQLNDRQQANFTLDNINGSVIPIHRNVNLPKTPIPASLILLYSTSTLYHSLRGRAKIILRKLDHLTIYLLIAGTYTPFCLVTLRGPWGWSLLGVVWGLAVVGMLQEIKPRSEARILSLVIYAVMGWVVLVAIKPLLEQLETAGFVWLASGGLLYTLGIVFYANDERFKHWHGIWHPFVIGGSLAQYIAVAGYVI